MRAPNLPTRSGLLLLALGALGVGGLLGAKKSPKTQTADRYELVDDSGVVRGVLGTWADSPYLRLQDQDGAGVMVLTQDGEVSLSMYTEGPRHPRVHVLAGDQGSTFTLLDRNGRVSVRVELDADGRVIQLTERPEAPMARSGAGGLQGGGLHGIWDTTPR